MKRILILMLAIPLSGLTQEGWGGNEVEEGSKEGRRCGTDPHKVNCNQVLEYDKNTQKVYHVKTGKPFTGSCESCHENGTVQYTATFKDGKEHGVSWSYYPDSAKHTMRTHEFGVETGDWKYWYTPADGGGLAWHHQYANGKLNGKCQWWFPDDNHSLKKVEHYKDGLLDGTSIKYISPDTMKSEISFKDGDYHGKYVSYFKNGQISIDANYNRGKKDGEEKHYFKDGQISFEGVWKNGKKDGKFTRYFKNGVTRSIETYSNGVKDGQFYEYYEEDGKLKREAVYEGGYLMSEFLLDPYGNYVDENGKKISEEDAKERNKIIRATSESRREQDSKRGKLKFDFASFDQELMCKCIQDEKDGKELSKECKKAKREFREEMAKVRKRDQRKLRQMISECEEK